jgi:hypothetical protein
VKDFSAMTDLHYRTTRHGCKITLFLEETGLARRGEESGNILCGVYAQKMAARKMATGKVAA